MTESMPAERKTYSPEDRQLIKDMVAKDLTEQEFGFLIHMAQTYHLDPFLGEIWAIKFGTAPARIFAGKNGFLKVAHESGQFNGMESGWEKMPDGDVRAWTKVYRKDAEHPFAAEVLASEYQRDTPIWKEKRVTMTMKVSQVHALRLAFPISGLYAPEEFGEAEKPPMKDVTPPKESGAGEAMVGGPMGKEAPIIDADAEQAKPARRQVKKGKVWVWEDTGEPVEKKGKGLTT